MEQKRKILLIEPNYKNKYPPMGLMKIATYYRQLGDEVTFFKGDLKNFILEEIYNELLEKLYFYDNFIVWEKFKNLIIEYIKKGKTDILNQIPLVNENILIAGNLRYYRQYFYNKKYFDKENRKWDRVFVTTLFTFYWNITIETINFAKQLCKDEKNVMVGGVMASILPNYIKEATGITPFVGPLNRASILDDNDIIVDILPLDYSILEEIEYEYPAKDGYLSYMTRGCINKCKFCAVPKLEPKYKNYLPIKKQLEEASKKFGKKKDLLLLDNNVLASNKFNEIIDEIKEAGFYKDSKYKPENLYEISIKNLKDGYNEKGYLRLIVKEYRKLIEKYGSKIQEIYDLLKAEGLLEFSTVKKEKVLKYYELLKPHFEVFYSKHSKNRYVDFNQGIDARLITKEKMEKLYEIPIKPVRIAFDSWKLQEIYENAVRIAVKAGHKDLSNYILYNFEDTPIEFYKRLKLNVELCEELGANIYSFPMKYHPIEDPQYFSNRDFIGKYWNRKFIRTIQAVLNSTKGKVGKGYSFFCKAFGETEEEFYKLLYMPEALIIYRLYFEKIGITEKWWNCFNSLPKNKLEIAKKIIETNNFSTYENEIEDEEILNLLEFYKIKREIAETELKNIVGRKLAIKN